MGEVLSSHQDALSSGQAYHRPDELVHRGAWSYLRHVLHRVAVCGAQVGARLRRIDLQYEPRTDTPWHGVTFGRCGHIRCAGEHAQCDTAAPAFEVFPRYPSGRPGPRTYSGKVDTESVQVSEQRPIGRSELRR